MQLQFKTRKRHLFSCKISFHSLLLFLISLNLNTAFAQEQAGTLEIVEGWEHRWGDSPLNEQGIPNWTYSDTSPSDWISPFSGSTINPPGRNKNSILWLRRKLPDGNWHEPYLFIGAVSFALEIYLAQEKIYQYRSLDESDGGKFHGDNIHFVPLPAYTPGDTLYFRIYSEDPNFIGLEDVKIGAKSEFWQAFFRNDLSLLILGFFFILSGIVPFITFFLQQAHKTYFAFGLLAVSIGAWVISHSILLSLWIDNPFLWFIIRYVFIFLTPIGVCLYFETIFSGKFPSFLLRLRQILLFTFLVLFPLLVITRPSATYWFLVNNFYFLLLVITLLSTFLMSIRYAIKGNREAQILTLGLAALAIFGVYDILGGVFELFPWSHNTFHWGMLLFVLALNFITERRLRNYSSAVDKYNAQLSESRFETLKTQVNPHFLFNSLNTLSSLIYIDQDDASEFVRKLSSVYRFVLETRDKELIDLQTELKILESYIYLAQTRFRESLITEIELDGINKQTKIVPLTLQMLIENAIKHNITSKSKPLTIKIFAEGEDYLVVQNNLQRKSSTEYSARIGLKNITARYGYLTDQPVVVEETLSEFIVKIPLLPKQEKGNT